MSNSAPGVTRPRPAAQASGLARKGVSGRAFLGLPGGRDYMDMAKQTPGAPPSRALPCRYTHVVMFDSAFDALRGAPPPAPRPRMLPPRHALVRCVWTYLALKVLNH